MTGSDDDTAISLLPYHRHLNGRCGAKSCVEHINAKSLQRVDHQLAYHWSTHAAIATYNNFFVSSIFQKPGAVSGSEFYDIKRCKVISGFTTNSSANT